MEQPFPVTIWRTVAALVIAPVMLVVATALATVACFFYYILTGEGSGGVSDFIAFLLAAGIAGGFGPSLAKAVCDTALTRYGVAVRRRSRKRAGGGSPPQPPTDHGIVWRTMPAGYSGRAVFVECAVLAGAELVGAVVTIGELAWLIVPIGVQAGLIGYCSWLLFWKGEDP